MIPKRSRPLRYALNIIIKGIVIGSLYVAVHLWRPKPTWRSQRFVELAVEDARRRGWGVLSVASAHLIASIAMRVRDDAAYEAWMDEVIIRYADEIKPYRPKHT